MASFKLTHFDTHLAPVLSSQQEKRTNIRLAGIDALELDRPWGKDPNELKVSAKFSEKRFLKVGKWK